MIRRLRRRRRQQARRKRAEVRRQPGRHERDPVHGGRRGRRRRRRGEDGPHVRGVGVVLVTSACGGHTRPFGGGSRGGGGGWEGGGGHLKGAIYAIDSRYPIDGREEKGERGAAGAGGRGPGGGGVRGEQPRSWEGAGTSLGPGRQFGDIARSVSLPFSLLSVPLPTAPSLSVPLPSLLPPSSLPPSLPSALNRRRGRARREAPTDPGGPGGMRSGGIGPASGGGTMKAHVGGGGVRAGERPAPACAGLEGSRKPPAAIDIARLAVGRLPGRRRYWRSSMVSVMKVLSSFSMAASTACRARDPPRRRRPAGASGGGRAGAGRVASHAQPSAA